MVMMLKTFCGLSLALSAIVVAAPQAPSGTNPSASWKPAASNLIHGQQMVYDLLANHADLKVIGIHGRAPGAENSTIGTILALNMDRIGKLDDAVDNEVAFKHNIVMEPNPKKSEYEVILPLMDGSGKILDNSINFVFKLEGRSAEDHLEFFARALVYRQEAARMLPVGKTLFTPVKTLSIKSTKHSTMSRRACEAGSCANNGAQVATSMTEFQKVFSNTVFQMVVFCCACLCGLLLGLGVLL